MLRHSMIIITLHTTVCLASHLNTEVVHASSSSSSSSSELNAHTTQKLQDLYREMLQHLQNQKRLENEINAIGSTLLNSRLRELSRNNFYHLHCYRLKNNLYSILAELDLNSYQQKFTAQNIAHLEATLLQHKDEK